MIEAGRRAERRVIKTIRGREASSFFSSISGPVELIVLHLSCLGGVGVGETYSKNERA